MRKLRIFISSPGDVGRERDAAGRVIARLRAEFAGRVELEPYFWEHEPMHAAEDFQGQIPPASQFHVFIGILWSRLGTRLHSRHARPDGTAFSSGTQFEFESALAAYRESSEKMPRIYIYRRSEIPSFPLEPTELREERLRQWEALKAFIDRWFKDVQDGGTFAAAINEYPNTADFEERLETHLRSIIGELAGEAGEFPAPTWKGGSPYRGLKVFEFEHAPLFFGRTRESDLIIGQLRDRANSEHRPFVLIFGSSGSGKSSLLRAGIIPSLFAGAVDGVGLWRRAMLRPSQSSGDLFDGLANALLQPEAMPELGAGGRSAGELARLLRENAPSVGAMISTALPIVAATQHTAEKQKLAEQAVACERESRMADAEALRQLSAALRFPEPRLVLGIDQLEEMFTHEERFPSRNRSAFFQAIDSLVQSGFVWVVATLRSDFFVRCEEVPELMALKAGKGEFHLTAPDAAQLGQIIRLPAQAAGVRFEDDPARGRLDDVLRDAAMAEPGSLPLLELTLDMLFQTGFEDRILSHREYEQLGGGEKGGLRGVLIQMADQAFAHLSPPSRECFGSVFKRLATTAGEGQHSDRFSRRVAALSGFQNEPREREVIDAFLNARLLVTDADADGQQIVSVAHEALLNEWPHLRRLLENERRYLRMRARVAARAMEWDREGKSRDRLATGVALAELREVEKAELGSLSPVERNFLTLSVRKNRRRWVLSMSGLLVLAMVFGLLAAVAVSRKRETQRILSSTDLTRAQELFEKGESAGALAFAARAIELDPGQKGPAADRLWFALIQRSWPVPVSAPMRHGDAVVSACFDQTGTRVLTASRDATARVWDAESGEAIGEPLRHSAIVRRACFHPDGTRVLTVCEDASVQMWDPRKAEPLWRAAQGDAVRTGAFSPSGRTVATGARDGTIRVWDSENGQGLVEFPQQSGNVHTLAFHPKDENHLLTVSANVARLWEISGATARERFAMPHHGAINSACFNATGDRILTAGEDSMARVWNTGSGQLEGEPFQCGHPVKNAVFNPGGTLIATGAGSRVMVWKTGAGALNGKPIEHAAAVLCLRFTRGGLQLVSGSADGRLQFWNVLDSTPLGEPVRERAAITSVEFSPDGQRVLSTTPDGLARVWNRPPLHPAGAVVPDAGAIEIVIPSPDGSTLLIGANDGRIRLWSVARRTFMPAVIEHKGLMCAAFSADGKRIATGSADAKARVWSVASGAEVFQPLAHEGGVCAIAFDPTGQSVATGTDTGIAHVWSVGQLHPRGRPMAHTAPITSIGFSPDGRTLLTGSEDASARMWDAVTGEPIGAALPASREVTVALFSPDGKTVAVASRDGSIGMWSRSGKALFPPLRHKAAVGALAYSPDGKRLATGSEDCTAAIWNTATGQSVCHALAHSFAVTAVAWNADGTRVATGAENGAVRVWDPGSGQAVSEWMMQEKPIRRLVFSPDGLALFSGATGGEVREWDVACALNPAEKMRLMEFVRALSPLHLQDSGRLEPREVEPSRVLKTAGQKHSSGSFGALMTWFFEPPLQRRLTPFSSSTLADYIAARIERGTPGALDEAEVLADGDPAILARISAKRGVPSP